jgi:hypothetical protein
MMAEQRFNRFNLAMGIGYDFVRQVTDAYFLRLPVPAVRARVQRACCNFRRGARR